MKEAIEILENELNEDPNIGDFKLGLRYAMNILKAYEPDHTWQPSPDTEYKVNLTEWIEQKEFALSDEAEKEKQRLLNDAVTRMQVLNINKLYLPPSTHAHPLDHEEGEG